MNSEKKAGGAKRTGGKMIRKGCANTRKKSVYVSPSLLVSLDVIAVFLFAQ
jgi:hypothetical protein